MRLMDCGAIYFAANTDPSNDLTIEGNFINETGKNTEGVSGTDASSGIYFDNENSFGKILNNMITKTDKGIFLHFGSNNVIENNVIWNSDDSDILLSDVTGYVLGRVPVTMRHNFIGSNFSFSVNTNPRVVMRLQLKSVDTIEQFLGRDDNTIEHNYVIPKGLVTQLAWRILTKDNKFVFNSAEWKSRVEPTLGFISSPISAVNELRAKGFKDEWLEVLEGDL
jgi:parallel beta-helix repeat protein